MRQTGHGIVIPRVFNSHVMALMIGQMKESGRSRALEMEVGEIKIVLGNHAQSDWLSAFFF